MNENGLERPLVNEEECLGCESSVQVCPSSAITVTEM